MEQLRNASVAERGQTVWERCRSFTVAGNYKFLITEILYEIVYKLLLNQAPVNYLINALLPDGFKIKIYFLRE